MKTNYKFLRTLLEDLQFSKSISQGRPVYKYGKLWFVVPHCKKFTVYFNKTVTTLEYYPFTEESLRFYVIDKLVAYLHTILAMPSE